MELGIATSLTVERVVVVTTRAATTVTRRVEAETVLLPDAARCRMEQTASHMGAVRTTVIVQAAAVIRTTISAILRAVKQLVVVQRREVTVSAGVVNVAQIIITAAAARAA